MLHLSASRVELDLVVISGDLVLTITTQQQSSSMLTQSVAPLLLRGEALISVTDNEKQKTKEQRRTRIISRSNVGMAMRSSVFISRQSNVAWKSLSQKWSI